MIIDIVRSFMLWILDGLIPHWEGGQAIDLDNECDHRAGRCFCGHLEVVVVPGLACHLTGEEIDPQDHFFGHGCHRIEHDGDVWADGVLVRTDFFCHTCGGRNLRLVAP